MTITSNDITSPVVERIRQFLQPRFDVRYGTNPTIVTALPKTGTRDGDIIRYKALASATGAFADVWWILTYDAAAAYWYVAGNPLIKEIDASQTTASTSYANLATTGPAITLPFAGDYLFTFGALMSDDTLNNAAVMSLDFGAGAADVDNIVSQGAAAAFVSLSRSRAQALAIATTVTAKYKVSGGTGTFAKRFLDVLPLRVH